MEGLFEILIPLIFAAIYFFGNMISSKSEDAPGSGERPKRGAGEDSEEAAERQRKIQEEIRRKIEERRRAGQGSGAPQSGPAQAPNSPEVPAPAVLRERRKDSGDLSQQPQPMEGRASVGPAVETSEIDDKFTWDKSDDAYDTDVERRLKEIEATKERAARLRKQADAARKKAGGTGEPRGRPSEASGVGLSGPVRETLRNPAAARRAFIYGEVLGRPKGLRRSESDVPGLVR